MNISNSISFTKLRSFGVQEYQDLYRLLLATTYNNDQGYGFDHVLMNKNLLSARLVKRIPTTIPKFDLSTGQFIDEQIFLFSEIDFVIDANLNLIEIYGPIKDAPKVRVALNPLLHSKVQSVSVQFFPYRLYSKLLQTFTTIKIENLTVSNFQYKEGIIGRYTIKSAELNLASQIIEQYGHDVTKLAFSVNDSILGDFTIAISSKGSLRVNCDEDLFPELLDKIKSVLFIGEGE